MAVVPEQLARLFFVPVGRERLQNKRASSPAQILNNDKLASASVTRVLVNYFYQCTGTLFYIFSPEESAELYRAVYTDPEGATKATLGALCAVACVASQYDDLMIESSLRRSYYETAKFYLDECIEEDEVLGMRVLCCLAIYCAMDKRLTAWTWVLTGLKLARLRGIHLDQRPVSTNPDEWIAQKKVLRTLIFLASWLSSTLGTNPEIVAAFEPGFEESITVVEENPPVESIAQEQMTAIGVITANILRDIFLRDELSMVTTREYRLQISDWFSNMPPIMHLDSLIRNSSLTVPQRRGIFLVHLNYLGALLLLYRRHVFHLATLHRDDPWEMDGDITEALGYAKDAVDVATQSARILGLLLSERAIFKRCWLAIYQSFSACTVLLFHVAQKRLHGCLPEEYEDELASAATCIRTLDYCAQCDAVARGYHDMLMFYYNALKTPPGNGATGLDSEPHTRDPNPNPNTAPDTMDECAIEDGLDGLPRNPTAHDLADGMGGILHDPYKYGWPEDGTEAVSSVHISNPSSSVPWESSSSYDNGVVADRAPKPAGPAVYADATVFGGPFQWTASSIPSYSRQ